VQVGYLFDNNGGNEYVEKFAANRIFYDDDTFRFKPMYLEEPYHLQGPY